MDVKREKVSKEREIEWMQLASEMLKGAVFEYFPEEDRMVLARYCQDGYHQEESYTQVWSMLEGAVHPEDMGRLKHFREQIQYKAARVYAEIRMKPDDETDYQPEIIRGKCLFQDGRMQKISGQIHRAEEQKSGFETSRDSMTGLWNYQYTREFIKEYLREDGVAGSFFIIDIDNLQKINDSKGYLFGDQVILSVSKALQNTFYESDIIGRLGGDEFVVFMKEESEIDVIQNKCQEICAAVSKVYCGEQSCQVTASIGVSRYPEDGFDYDELFQKADCALNYSRNKNYCAVYNDSVEEMVDYIRQNYRQREESQVDDDKEDTYNEFYYEVTDLTFRLMEETTDTDSAVHLLMHKLKEHFQFDVVNIQEVVGDKERTLRYIYEVRNESMKKRLHTCRSYAESEWMTLRYAMEQGRYLYDARQPISTDLFLDDGVSCSALRIPLGNRKFFTGVMDFVYASKEHVWQESEIKFLESFVRIISVYLNRIRVAEEAGALVTMMQERDSITGLYSYEKFLERMKELTKEKDADTEIYYVYMDVCHFKYINETYGYDNGDRLLRKLAEQLVYMGSKELMCITRVHSDNLVMAICNTYHYSVEELAQMVEDRLEKICERLKGYMHDNTISACSGIFLTADPDISVEEAVSNAAYACKEGKKNSGCKCMIFTEELRQAYKKQLNFLRELQEAIERRELTVFIQPKMMADGKHIAGGEALIRWIKENHQVIRPDDFIPVFEKSGAIVEVDYFVYREVFSYLRRRLDAGLPVVPVSVNVSRMHLDNGDIVGYVDGLFEEYKLDPSLIEFELTESIYIDDLDKANRLVAGLRRRGCRVSMDDFGSGYSSLNMLSRMPIDVMKIDRIFLKENGIQENDKVILECVINMARKLNMHVVCEGVETGEQYEFLRNIGCDMMQGYYFGKPMSMEDFDNFLNETGVA